MASQNATEGAGNAAGSVPQTNTSSSPPPNKFFDPTQAFALPEGTVRASIALMVLGADIFMQCYYKWAPPTLDTMATVAFTFYFAQAATRGLGVKNA